MKEKRRCAECGDVFVAVKPRAKFCTRKCSAISIAKKREAARIKQFTGKRFGNVVVIRFDGCGPDGRPRVLIKCDCGNECIRYFPPLKDGTVYSCGCAKGGVTMYGGISKAVLGRIKRAASVRGIEFSVTPEYLWELFQGQRGRCALTGKPIVIPDKANKPSESTASLDRIDSSDGYVVGNLQWVHKDVNRIKWILPQDEFILICKQVAEHFYEPYDPDCGWGEEG